MSLTKKSTIALISAFFLLSMGFTLMSNKVFAAQDPVDVCEQVDAEEVDDTSNDDESKPDAQDLCEKAESDKLASHVDVTEAEARATALSNNSNKGSVTEILLARDEDDKGVSTIVYEIELTAQDGTKTDVKVDAMTGKYLDVDTEDGDQGGDTKESKGGMGNSANMRALQTQLLTLLQQLITLLKSQ